ncbi:unnamed protein product [Brassica rapa subsp. narinosa]
MIKGYIILHFINFTGPYLDLPFCFFLAVKMVTNKEEREVVELVGYILSHVLYSHPS